MNLRLGLSFSMDEVLGTTELLEAILLSLDQRTLLVSAQRVNHTWHTLIQISTTLQQALFFRPSWQAMAMESRGGGCWGQQREETGRRGGRHISGARRG